MFQFPKSANVPRVLPCLIGGRQSSIYPPKYISNRLKDVNILGTDFFEHNRSVVDFDYAHSRSVTITLRDIPGPVPKVLYNRDLATVLDHSFLCGWLSSALGINHLSPAFAPIPPKTVILGPKNGCRAFTTLLLSSPELDAPHHVHFLIDPGSSNSLLAKIVRECFYDFVSALRVNR